MFSLTGWYWHQYLPVNIVSDFHKEEMYRQATGVKMYLWFKHDAYCCKRLKKILFTFSETKTVFANRVLKWEELIFSPTSTVVTETWIRLETIETIVHKFSNRTREFSIYNLKLELVVPHENEYPLYKIPQAQLPV